MSSNVVTYCPNCRYEINPASLGWICWRTFRRNGTAAAGPSKDLDEAARAAWESGTGSGRYAQLEDKLCECFNPPDATSCSAENCGRQKQQGSFHHACPICHMEIPPLENMSAHTITIAGPAGAGKTHYIVALNNWWTRHLGQLGLMALPAMGHRIQEVFDDYRSTVIEQKNTLRATVKDEMISFSWQIVAPAHNEEVGILFTLPDVSGERLLRLEQLAANRHFHFSSGVVLLLDGERIAASHGLGNETKRDPMDHLQLIQAMIRDFRNRLPRNEIRALPIAVCVNKVDLLESLDPQWKHIMRDHQPRHDGQFDFNACFDRSEAIAQVLLQNADTAGIVNLVKLNFDNVMFFAMATIGSESKPVKFRPLAVEDPFLWMLWLIRMIP